MPNAQPAQTVPRAAAGSQRDDPGLASVLAAAEGVCKLAALVGVRHPSVSRWRRVPAARVLQIEAALGGAVTRQQMRPDLYPE